MVFDNVTPNTVNYLIAGYAVLLGLPLLYIVSWVVRRRNLKRQMELLETLAKEKEAEAKTPRPPA